MNWQAKRVLVTGAGGFIGSHLVELLAGQGAEVRAMLRYSSRTSLGDLEFLPAEIKAGLDIIRGDITDPGFCLAACEGVSHVFHLAALIGIPYSYLAPQHYLNTNLQGTLNLLEACRRSGVERMVHTSTSEVYGTAQTVPIAESHPINPQSPYAASKAGADHLAMSYHLSFELPVAVIRPFNTYGPRQSPRAVIPTIASQLLGGSGRVELGSLEPVRDLTFVTDTCQGFLAVASADEALGRVTNVGGGGVVSIGELADMMIRLHGEQAELVTSADRVRPPASEVMRLVCDNTRARQLGWSPQVSLEQGLAKVLEFTAAHPDRFRPAEYTV